MDMQRTGNGYAANAIGFREIAEWCRLRDIRLLQWQLDAILALDAKRREVLNQRVDEETSDEQNVSERQLSSDLFDALFQG